MKLDTNCIDFMELSEDLIRTRGNNQTYSTCHYDLRKFNITKWVIPYGIVCLIILFLPILLTLSSIVDRLDNFLIKNYGMIIQQISMASGPYYYNVAIPPVFRHHHHHQYF